MEVSPDTADASELGETVQFQAEARDADGNVVSGVSLSWTSTDGSVATVDGQGTATAEANGAADIEATASGVTGSAYLAVRAGELSWSRIRAGNIFGCGLTTHGTAFCWGNNHNGEGGYGVSSSNVQTDPRKVSGGHTFREITASGNHTCAVRTDGAAYFWGNKERSQLGIGPGQGGNVPAELPDPGDLGG